MVIDTVFGLNSIARQPQEDSPNIVSRVVAAVSWQLARLWCGMHGHLILLHFEPNKLSLQCGLCGYQSEGWEVGMPAVARRGVDHRAHNHHVRVERRRVLRTLPDAARMAS